MSYCRFSAASDCYVFRSAAEIWPSVLVCYGCKLTGGRVVCATPAEMIAHLDAHRSAGHQVDPWAVWRLLDEMRQKEGQKT